MLQEGVRIIQPMPRNIQNLLRFMRRMLAVLLAFSFLVEAAPVSAQGKERETLRDAEIEALLRDYARPIFRAAKVGGVEGVEIVIINDRSFNAFVADSRRIFITVGALLDAKTPNEVIGVLAHETGHIAGGHLARLREELKNARTTNIIAMLASAAAIGLGAAAGASGRELGGAASGLAAGGMGFSQRKLLAYQRTEEAAADSAAVNYLNASGQSAQGMVRTFQRFADEGFMSARHADPYAQSHPMPRDRIAHLQNLVAASPYKNKSDDASLQQRHDMMRAKISGYLEQPQQVARRYGKSGSLPTLYARAISLSRSAGLEAGLREMDALIAAQPDNPYFHELKGQTLLENGRPRDAIAPYRRAVSLAPNSALLRIGLGRALVSTENTALLDEAIGHIERGVIQDTHSGDGYQFLAMAYGRKGDEARASLATARGYFESGKIALAKQAAARARDLLPKGSPGWLKADDILRHGKKDDV